jgi:TRAP-type C4-dicarboxylate transport system permease large subunit
MIGLMIIAASVFTYLVGSSGMIGDISKLITGARLSPWLILISINVTLLVMGSLMDGLAIFMVSMPVFIPIVVALDFDPIWFGVIVVVNLEIGLITPPVALNFFLMKGVFNVRISELIRGVLPFLIVLIIFLGVLIAFPQLSLWLPELMKGR